MLLLKVMSPVLKRDRLLVLREGANTDHPSWTLPLYARAAVFASNLMFVGVLGPCYWLCKAGPPLSIEECPHLDVHSFLCQAGYKLSVVLFAA